MLVPITLKCSVLSVKQSDCYIKRHPPPYCHLTLYTFFISYEKTTGKYYGKWDISEDGWGEIH